MSFRDLTETQIFESLEELLLANKPHGYSLDEKVDYGPRIFRSCWKTGEVYFLWAMDDREALSRLEDVIAIPANFRDRLRISETGAVTVHLGGIFPVPSDQITKAALALMEKSEIAT